MIFLMDGRTDGQGDAHAGWLDSGSKLVFSIVPEPPSKQSHDQFSSNEEELDHDSTKDSPTRSHQLNSKHKTALEDSSLGVEVK